MKTEEIRRILELYYEGKTTESEEIQLVDYFSGTNIAPELMDERLIFQSLHADTEISNNQDLEVKLNNLIDELAEKEEKSIKLKSSHNKRHSRPLFWIAGVAASLAMLLSIGLLYQNSEQTIETNHLVLRDTYSDPKQAYAETEKALLLISSKLNKGLSGIETLQEGIEKSNEIIDKNFNQIK